jgi:hypothetical protein
LVIVISLRLGWVNSSFPGYKPDVEKKKKVIEKAGGKEIEATDRNCRGSAKPQLLFQPSPHHQIIPSPAIKIPSSRATNKQNSRLARPSFFHPQFASSRPQPTHCVFSSHGYDPARSNLQTQNIRFGPTIVSSIYPVRKSLLSKGHHPISPTDSPTQVPHTHRTHRRDTRKHAGVRPARPTRPRRRPALAGHRCP